MLYPTVLRYSTVFQPIIIVYTCIVKVSHDHVLLLRILNNLMHMWHHVTNHLIISNDKNSNSENRIKLRVRDKYKEFARLFSDEVADRFPPSREWDHAIDLKPGAPDALDCKVYPMTRDEDASLEKFLDEMVAKGYILSRICRDPPWNARNRTRFRT
jgi:hypothetical protein